MKNKIKKWKLISREIVFQKYARKIEKAVFKHPNGNNYDLYLKKEEPTVAILPISSDKKIITIKQFRPGPNKIFYELPGGFHKIGSPQKTAAKELLEETGYRGDLKYVSKCFDCAYSTMVRYCFVALNCRKIEKVANSIHDDYKDGKGFPEEKEVVLLSIPKFRALLQSGKMTDIEIGYLGLDYLGLL